MEPKVIELKYEPEDGILNVYFSKNKVDDSYDLENFKSLAIMHVDKKDNPVYLEIFNASENFNVTLKTLPEKIREELLAPA